MENEKIIQPLTAEIMEEADEGTSRQLKYFREHQEELDKMTMDERFAAMMKAAKENAKTAKFTHGGINKEIAMDMLNNLPSDRKEVRKG